MKSNRKTPIEINEQEFRRIGHQLVDSLADFLENISEKPVTTGESPEEAGMILGNSRLPQEGLEAGEIISRASDLLLNHSLLNGHPKFLGYITSSPSPIGALADLLASVVNPNVGANVLSPMATEIEKQALRWLAEFIGIPASYGGIFVSGGNMANFTAYLAARTVKSPEDTKKTGIINESHKMLVYCSRATHTWIEKASGLFGLGTDSIRWIDADDNNRMNTVLLEQNIKNDIERGYKPILAVGNAGDVSTGAVDDLKTISLICKKYNLWFHIDGAYGIPAVVVPELKKMFDGMSEADSIAIDPHKWLYSPLEAGCTFVRDPNHLLKTFSTHPVYYNFNSNDGSEVMNFYEYGLQNSRGFRALKVWVTLQKVGRNGYEKMIEQDVHLSRLLFEKANKHPEIKSVTQNLSITTLRFVPLNIEDSVENETILNKLNEDLLNEIQKGGELFLSNAIVRGKYCLRACFVNFRTSEKDIDEIVEIIAREGRKIFDRSKNLSMASGVFKI